MTRFHTFEGTNTYLIGRGKQRILLDTGQGIPAYTPLLNQVLTENQIFISTILLSHYHHDHVLGLGSVLSLTNQAPTIYKYPHHTDNTDLQQYNLNPIRDGQRWTVDGASLQAVYSPGHTDDHISFFLEEEQALFSGDTVLGQGTSVFSDLSKYISSLNSLLQLKPQIIYPAHGPEIIGAAKSQGKIQEYIKHRLERERQVLAVMTSETSNGVTSMDIVKAIYKDYPSNLWPAAEHGIVLHLKKLEVEGRISPVSSEENKWMLSSKM